MNNEVVNLRKALELHTSVENTKQKLATLRSAKYSDPPAPPKKPVLQQIPDPVYPLAEKEDSFLTFFLSFGWKYFVPDRTYSKLPNRIKFIEYIKHHIPLWRKILYGACCVLLLLVFSFNVFTVFSILLMFAPFFAFAELFFFSRFTKQEVAKARNSTEYAQQCQAMDRAVAEQRAKAAAAYDDNLAMWDRAMNQYNTVTLPNYNKAKSEWETNHQKEISDTEALLARYQTALNNHYAVTRVVPEQYRNTEALNHIYKTVSTSNYTIVGAIHNYEQWKLQRTEEARLYEQRRAADAEERRYQAEQERARRDRERDERNEARREREASRNRNSSNGPARKDYWLSSGCQRAGVGGKSTCAGCTLAPYCTRCK